jgi:ribosome-associated translation inhibitor RaiA
MGSLDFHFEFYSEIENLEQDLITEAETRMRELKGDKDDLIGASVAVEELAQEDKTDIPYFYEARVVAYIRPDNLVATEKGESAEAALKGALNAIERRVRKQREKLRTQYQQPPQTPSELET